LVCLILDDRQFRSVLALLRLPERLEECVHLVLMILVMHSDPHAFASRNDEHAEFVHCVVPSSAYGTNSRLNPLGFICDARSCARRTG
jgi:hypothetical protein